MTRETSVSYPKIEFTYNIFYLALIFFIEKAFKMLAFIDKNICSRKNINALTTLFFCIVRYRLTFGSMCIQLIENVQRK